MTRKRNGEKEIEKERKKERQVIQATLCSSRNQRGNELAHTSGMDLVSQCVCVRVSYGNLALWLESRTKSFLQRVTPCSQ